MRLVPSCASSWIALVLFSLVGAATTVVGLRVVRTKWFYSGNYEENYFAGLQAIDALWFVLLFIAILCVVLLIFVLYQILNKRIPLRRKALNPTVVFCVSWLVIFICWVPYLLVNFPCALYADSIVIIKQALGINALSSHHPIAYVGLIGVFLHIGDSFFSSHITGIALYAACQMVFMSGAFAYVLAWLARRRVPFPAIAVIGTLFALMSIFPLHAVSMWKDGLYGSFALLLSVLLFDIVASRGTLLARPSVLVRLFLWGTLLCLIRSNGIYVMALVWLALIVLYLVKQWRAVLPIVASIAVFAAVVGPLSAALEVKTEPVESYGIPLQQVAAVVVFDGTMTPEQEEFLDTLLPLEDYKSEYIPCSVDGIKWADNFNTEFFDEHQVEFMRMWAELALANKRIYAAAFIMESYEYWSFADVARNITYNGVNDKYDAPDLGIIETNLLVAWFGDGAKNFFPFKFLHPQEGLASWAILLAGLLLFVAAREVGGRYRNAWWLFLVPAFANWLSVVISSPFAALPRYILPAIFMLPILVVLPWLVKSLELQT